MRVKPKCSTASYPFEHKFSSTEAEHQPGQHQHHCLLTAGLLLLCDAFPPDAVQGLKGNTGVRVMSTILM